MQTVTSNAELQALLNPIRATKRIAFIPTMGNLHEGHLSLVRKGHESADIIVVSIFVNPMQFGANEDLDTYPRTLAMDKEKLIAEKCHILFTPSVNDIYPSGIKQQTRVSVPELGNAHCGQSRPGHFDGVSTVVAKLFNIVQPHCAVFGEKDFQQLAIIKKMVNDLCLPLEIIACTTGRADDGLALSSRNQYLNEQERAIAPLLNQAIITAKKALIKGKKIKSVRDNAIEKLTDAGFMVDYFNIVDADTLADVNVNSREIVILAAAFLGTPRLIDNQTCPLNPAVI